MATSYERVYLLKSKLRSQQLSEKQKESLQQDLQEVEKLLATNKTILKSLQNKNQKTFMFASAMFLIIFIIWMLYHLAFHESYWSIYKKFTQHTVLHTHGKIKLFYDKVKLKIKFLILYSIGVFESTTCPAPSSSTWATTSTSASTATPCRSSGRFLLLGFGFWRVVD